MKKILVATGTSENKKGFAVDYIQHYLAAKGIQAQVVSANIYTLDIAGIQPDVIVAIGPVNFQTYIPVITGTAFVTKIGMDAVCESIVHAL